VGPAPEPFDVLRGELDVVVEVIGTIGDAGPAVGQRGDRRAVVDLPPAHRSDAEVRAEHRHGVETCLGALLERRGREPVTDLPQEIAARPAAFLDVHRSQSAQTR